MVNIIKIGPNDAKILKLKINEKPKSFLAITHPDCHYCKEIKPTLNKLYKIFKQSKEDINFINIHGNAFQESLNFLPNKYKSFQGYPTILTKNKSKINEYNGDRNLQSLIDHCIKQLNIKDPIILNILQSGGKKKTKKYKKGGDVKSRKIKKDVNNEEKKLEQIAKSPETLKAREAAESAAKNALSQIDSFVSDLRSMVKERNFGDLKNKTEEQISKLSSIFTSEVLENPAIKQTWQKVNLKSILDKFKGLSPKQFLNKLNVKTFDKLI